MWVVNHVIGWLDLQCRSGCSCIQRVQYHTTGKAAAWKPWKPTYCHSWHRLKHQLCRVAANVSHPSEANEGCDRLPGLRPTHLHLKARRIDPVLFLHLQLVWIQSPVFHCLRIDLIKEKNQKNQKVLPACPWS